jgi:hypothetical protein
MLSTRSGSSAPAQQAQQAAEQAASMAPAARDGAAAAELLAH